MSTVTAVYDADMWKQSSLYFVLTDRFNNPAAGTAPCAASNSYCGGTWKGIKDKIPYIKGKNSFLILSRAN
jgi:alpha-amylase